MKPHNGHRSWNAWNVSLWLGNDESYYRLALDCLKRAGGRRGIAAEHFLREIGHDKTPDGARWSKLSVSLGMRDLA